jgi:hypothetical protein
MYAYQLKNDPEKYKVVVQSSYELSKNLGVGIRTMQSRMISDESMGDIWKVVKVQAEQQSPTAETIPDVSVWGNGWLVLSKNAYEKLLVHLEELGEFLPVDVDVDGNEMFIFRCTSWAKEDESECILHYVDGEVDGLEHLAFDQEEIDRKLLFKSKLQGGSVVYCSPAFKGLCSELKLDGLRYDENLITPF